MENIYPPSQFTSTEPFSLKEYFASYSECAKLEEEPDEVPCQAHRSDAIFEWLGIKASETILFGNDIAKICSTDNLKSSDGHDPEDFRDHIDEAYITLDYPIEITEKAKKLEAVRARVESLKSLDHLLYRTLCGKEWGEEINRPSKSTPNDITPGSDFVVHVRVYRPYIFKFDEKNLSNRLKLSHEIQVLGSNKLTDLRDKIKCNADVGLCKEVRTTVVTIDPDEAKRQYPSNFLFIENVFYNDMRSVNAIDYSEVIREWAKEKDLRGFKTVNMENVLIKDLKPRIGYPYVYQHQGNCEHIIVFSDARLISRNESLCLEDYPLISKLKRKHSMLCNICGLVNARWICAHSERLPNEYTSMCHECFVSYNFIDNKKVGNFKAYPLADQTSK